MYDLGADTALFPSWQLVPSLTICASQASRSLAKAADQALPAAANGHLHILQWACDDH